LAEHGWRLYFYEILIVRLTPTWRRVNLATLWAPPPFPYNLEQTFGVGKRHDHAIPGKIANYGRDDYVVRARKQRVDCRLVDSRKVKAEITLRALSQRLRLPCPVQE
jgi:hypothetical protein